MAPLWGIISGGRSAFSGRGCFAALSAAVMLSAAFRAEAQPESDAGRPAEYRDLACRDRHGRSSPQASAPQEAVFELRDGVDRDAALDLMRQSRFFGGGNDKAGSDQTEAFRIDESTPTELIRIVSTALSARQILEVLGQEFCDLISFAARNPLVYSPVVDGTRGRPEVRPQSVPLLPEVYDPADQWGLRRIGAIDAWTTAGLPPAFPAPAFANDVIVGLLDTNIELTHPDLAPNIWHSQSGVRVVLFRKLMECKIEFGVNIVGRNCEVGDCQTQPCNFTTGHGTLNAGVIAAVGGNDEGVTGVSWGARVLPIVVLNKSTQGSLFDLIEAINVAIQLKNNSLCDCAGLNVLSASVAFRSSEPLIVARLLETISKANYYDIILVVATGNMTGDIDQMRRPPLPAVLNLDNVVAVTASGEKDERLGNAPFGNSVDIAAPGERIHTTEIDHQYTRSGAGTSIATPFVAGAAAFVLQVCGDMPPGELRRILTDKADNIGQTAVGWATVGAQSMVRLNVDRAVTACLGRAAGGE